MGRVVRAQQTYKAATGATVADLPQILTALLAADNDMRGSAEATLRVVATWVKNWQFRLAQYKMAAKAILVLSDADDLSQTL